MAFEANIIKFLQSNATVGWIHFFNNFTSLASVIGLIFFAIIIFLKNKRLSLWFILSFGLLALINQFLKNIIQRPRPFEVYNFITNLGNASGFSFPSGHSASAAIIALFICYYAFRCSKKKSTRALVIVTMTLYTLMICLSRMLLGAHYLTDTIAGVGLGLLVGAFMIFIYHKYIKNITISIKVE